MWELYFGSCLVFVLDKIGGMEEEVDFFDMFLFGQGWRDEGGRLLGFFVLFLYGTRGSGHGSWAIGSWQKIGIGREFS